MARGEHSDPLRQPGDGAGPQPFQHRGAARQGIIAESSCQQPPEVGLPGVGAQRRAVRADVGVPGPGCEHRRTVPGVAGELAGNPVSGGEALPGRRQVGLQHGQRRVVGLGGHSLHQPREPLGTPGIFRSRESSLEGCKGREVDARADAWLVADRGQPLGEPALEPRAGHHGQVEVERVLAGFGPQ